MATANDAKEGELIVFSCPKCKISREESAKEFFSEIPSLLLLPKIVCKRCGTQIVVELKE